MKKAIFLDRDGVVNIERGEYTWKREDIALTPDLIPFLREARKKGYLLIVITNQGGIGKGLYSLNEYYTAESYIAELLQQEGTGL
jgi:D-glycero-D-manno-heptose 1,7-bisphosphate phosphatase